MAISVGLISRSDILRDALSASLGARGFKVRYFESAKVLASRDAVEQMDCVILDLNGSGRRTLGSAELDPRELRSLGVTRPIVVLTDELGAPATIQTRVLRLQKPIDPLLLSHTIHQISLVTAKAAHP